MNESFIRTHGLEAALADLPEGDPIGRALIQANVPFIQQILDAAGHDEKAVVKMLNRVAALTLTYTTAAGKDIVQMMGAMLRVCLLEAAQQQPDVPPVRWLEQITIDFLRLTARIQKDLTQ